jgi:hypothetical protein
MPRYPKDHDKTLESLPSENEGRIMTAEGRRYLVQNGRRLWIDSPPKGWNP